MAEPYDLYMTMLFVGQGMGNLLTITQDGDKDDVVANLLMDFGAKDNRRIGPDTVEFVYNVLTAWGTTDGHLDLVTISHRDRDHWTLYYPLIDQFTKNGKNLTIGRLKHGGYKDTYAKFKRKIHGTVQNKSILGYLTDRINPKPPIEDYLPKKSFYSKNQPLPLLAKWGADDEVRVIPVAVNASTESKDASTRNNTPSLAISIIYKFSTNPVKTRSLFLPGDATADTLRLINNVLDAAPELKRPVMMSVPHHGALHSIASNYNTNSPKLDVADQFAAKIWALSIGASAGFNTYRHPEDSVFAVFRPYLSKAGLHDYVSYFPAKRPAGTWRATRNTREAIYTNYTSYPSDGSPPRARRILFKLAADGGVTIAVLPPGGASLDVAATRSFTAMPSVRAQASG
ncbi:MAG TPA: hypothetical protein VGB79_03045 [Allosphingosinicella sp.]|jgi:hypothetical protein